MIEVEIKLSNEATTSRAPCVRVLDVTKAAGCGGHWGHNSCRVEKVHLTQDIITFASNKIKSKEYAETHETRATSDIAPEDPFLYAKYSNCNQMRQFTEMEWHWV